MFKKTIKYDDLEGNEISNEFHFHVNKLEALELDLHTQGGLQGYIEQLQNTDDGPQAYELFKKIVVLSYGKKLNDASFRKSPALTEEFVGSDALGSFIIEMLENPALGNQFVEGVLPARLVKEIEAERAKQNVEPHLAPITPMTQRFKDDEYSAGDEGSITQIAPPTRKELTEMSKEELLKAFQERNGE